MDPTHQAKNGTPHSNLGAVEWPLAKDITSTEREADVKGTLHYYWRTAIFNELLDNKSAVLTRPSHGVN
jgi:hypothetical protein